VKPLDSETILEEVKKAGAVVTVEEHQMAGGFGSAVAELLSAHAPVPIEMVAVKDVFGQSGEPEELIRHYQLDAGAIIEAVKRVQARKKS
jgi:transketolase